MLGVFVLRTPARDSALNLGSELTSREWECEEKAQNHVAIDAIIAITHSLLILVVSVISLHSRLMLALVLVLVLVLVFVLVLLLVLVLAIAMGQLIDAVVDVADVLFAAISNQAENNAIVFHFGSSKWWHHRIAWLPSALQRLLPPYWVLGRGSRLRCKGTAIGDPPPTT